MLYFCTNFIFGKHLVPEIWAKILLINQIVNFLNQLYQQNHEKAWSFACWYKFMEIDSWLKNIRVGMVKKKCGYSGHRTLKLAVFQEGINGINWFFYFNKFWVIMVKNGCGLLGHGTLKSAGSQEWMMK